MAGRNSRRAEIEALAAELARPSAAAADATAAAGPSGRLYDDAIADALGLGAAGAAEALALLDELKDRLDDGLTETRDFTSHNPVTALAAAFLLGLVVGRLWRS